MIASRTVAAHIGSGLLAGMLLWLLAVPYLGQDAGKQDRDNPVPTHSNAAYGAHERNVLDFWQAKSDKPAPLVVFIHGGGFTGGSKDQISANVLKELLEAGISVAAIHYRLLKDAPLPAAHQDATRALQFLRFKAGEWNLDKRKFGAFGGSAGAQLCMYLAFHDEMADPESADPVKRESTRLTSVATTGGQTTMDFDWWTKNIPGYDKLHKDPLETFGVKTKAEYLARAKEVSALTLVSKDDPPIFMGYGMAPDDPVPDDPRKAQSWKIHHVIFGVKLKEEMDRLGIEADLKYPGAKTRYGSIPAFFKAKLQAGRDEIRPLFDGQTLNGWVVRAGKASYKVEDGAIAGTTTEGSHNTFLCTGREFSDFELLFEVKCDRELNSGVQIRSHLYEKDTPQPSNPKRIRPAGDVYGYQVEIAADGNAGRVWDEARQAKWHDPEPSEQTRKAYRPDEWNRYRIVAQGERIRTWINDAPVADIRVKEDAAGFIGLQVHSIKPGTGPYQVRWRNIRIRELKPGELVH